MKLYSLIDALRNRLRRRRWTHERASGVRGEDLAHRLLDREKYLVVARNYRSPSGSGEIDIIAWDGDTLAVVEVKTRATDDYGPPERAIGEHKRRRMERAALDYTRRAGIEWDQVRFDVVTVIDGTPPVLTLYRDALAR
jgi:putative endonuclease